MIFFNTTKSLYIALLITSTLLLNSGCQVEDINADNTSNGNIQPNTGTALLRWTPPTEYTNNTSIVDLTGYNIYYGTDPAFLSNKIAINNPYALNYSFNNLNINQTYYFSVAAVTNGTMEGIKSAIVSKSL